MPLEEIKKARLKKLKRLAEQGDVFPSEVSRDRALAEVVESFPKLSRKRRAMVLVGRILQIRMHGGVIFCDFNDGTGVLQAYIKKDFLDKEKFSFFEQTVDIGDFIEFKGTLFKTKKGEKSIKVSDWRMLSKGLLPLPEKWHGLSDIEERFRKRYLDLLMNKDVRDVFVLRSRIISEIRNFLDKNNFLEVETPMLQPIAGGAFAEPFKTHHSALGIDLFLRIAPELYLKKLLVGGFEKVYEIGKCFRNEGIDTAHNPEFTMIEFYQAYCNTDFMKKFVEDLIKCVMKSALKKKSLKFKTTSFGDMLKRHALINDLENISHEDLKLKAQQFGIEVLEFDNREKIMDNIFKKICRPKIKELTFVTDYPIGLFPLTKKKSDNENLADAFQLIGGGFELVKAYSELNDPIDQKQRFEKQKELRGAGDKEALEFDQSYIDAMEYGMPPAVGVGIGVDRLVMFLLDIHNIKESILFPTMRPKD